MLILVLDCCGPCCAVGVWQDGRMRAQISEPMERGQDARIIPLVIQVLEKAEKTYEQLDRIAVTRGPGSFTGARVGLAAARGLGLAANKIVIGIDRFAMYRKLQKNLTSPLLIVLSSKRLELFCKFYPVSGVNTDPFLMNAVDIQAFITSHKGTEIAGDIASPDASTLEACAQIAATADERQSDSAPRPLYLRAPDVTLSSR